MADVVPAANEKPLFTKKHELNKLLAGLKKASPKALQVLEKGLESQDERVRMIAAEKLLKFYTDIADSVRQTEIKTLLLDIKVNGLIGQGSTADDDDTPALDFDNISPEFQDAQVIDMGNVSKI